LSKETLEIIKKAKEKPILGQATAETKSISNILSKPSLRDRFQNLHQIVTTKDLLTYTKYKNFINAFEHIDGMISFMK
jgi:hypothetical protein